ncbi:TetR family transcriptional regulator [Paenibacillus glacialis]|uniref:TetR/AcrR family transcriptional regulator n=1 Tax=Paenibacillus glacialis TaxID=494026 RepID=UPI0009FFC9EE
MLEAGLDLFIRKGYRATKIADIAKKSNMSLGLYSIFLNLKKSFMWNLLRLDVQEQN